MKIKTYELTGAALDWVVAKCEGVLMIGVHGFVRDVYDNRAVFEPPTNWAQGGPIIEREEIGLAKSLRGVWAAVKYDEQQRVLAFEDGPTPLIAAMRCYVASKLGDEVEIPEELK